MINNYNNENITYDEIGNPLTIGNKILNWINGRQLESYNDLNNTINYKYNKDGIRISKKINNVETKYYLEGKNIIIEKTNNNVLYYMYNNLNELLGFNYNNDIYYYVKNIQDDVIGILDSNYNLIVKYIYDSWGNIISIKDNNGNDISNDNNHIGNINPFRYRSYYYDKETNLYYLNSRYYNPVWGRFINADPKIGSSGEILSYNLYIYVDNIPIINVDSDGLGLFKNMWNNLYNFGRKVAQTTRNIWNTIKNAFVFDAGVGVGFDVKNSSILGVSAGYSKDMTYKYENQKSSTGTTTSVSASFTVVREIGYSKSVYHEEHKGDYEVIQIHNNPFHFTNQIIDCEHTEISETVFITTKYSGKIEQNEESTFIGLDFSAHLGVGGHLKIGFNIGW